MDKHKSTHQTGAYVTVSAPYGAREAACNGHNGPDAFGYDGCHRAVEAIIGGLHYSTASADLVAVNDGQYFGVYLFRTKGGRYFTVRHNYPMTRDSTDPLEPVSLNEALRLYSTITSGRFGYVTGSFAPFDVAFPDVKVEEA